MSQVGNEILEDPILFGYLLEFIKEKELIEEERQKSIQVDQVESEKKHLSSGSPQSVGSPTDKVSPFSSSIVSPMPYNSLACLYFCKFVKYYKTVCRMVNFEKEDDVTMLGQIIGKCYKIFFWPKGKQYLSLRYEEKSQIMERMSQLMKYRDRTFDVLAYMIFNHLRRTVFADFLMSKEYVEYTKRQAIIMDDKKEYQSENIKNMLQKGEREYETNNNNNDVKRKKEKKAQIIANEREFRKAVASFNKSQSQQRLRSLKDKSERRNSDTRRESKKEGSKKEKMNVYHIYEDLHTYTKIEEQCKEKDKLYLLYGLYEIINYEALWKSGKEKERKLSMEQGQGLDLPLPDATQEEKRNSKTIAKTKKDIFDKMETRVNEIMKNIKARMTKKDGMTRQNSISKDGKQKLSLSRTSLKEKPIPIEINDEQMKEEIYEKGWGIFTLFIMENAKYEIHGFDGSQKAKIMERLSHPTETMYAQAKERIIQDLQDLIEGTEVLQKDNQIQMCLKEGT